LKRIDSRPPLKPTRAESGFSFVCRDFSGSGKSTCLEITPDPQMPERIGIKVARGPRFPAVPKRGRNLVNYI